MEQEREFDQYLGGAPREAVQEFKKPGELSEDDLKGEELREEISN